MNNINKFIENLVENKLADARKVLNNLLYEKVSERLLEEKKEIVAEMFCEATRNPNIIRQGRVIRIKRRIRRNPQGRIIVQKNVRRSAMPGFRVSGSKIQRIPAIERIRRSRLLKRSWKTTRRSKLRRTLMKRKMSMQRRLSMGLR
ncbi:MAG: hypothetical protein EOM92_22370 [Gammaproteobacteria bacterium]|nr:hypothetical protein [Gammaproteobacteria bacterium]